jgi:hypothetical protein
MLQWLYTYVVNVYSQCFICFLDICCKCVYLDVAYVSHICCKCLSVCCVYVAMVFKCFMCFFASVSDACFKHFICLQTYVASVVSECFKSKSVLYLPPRLLLPRLVVSSSPSAALHPSQAAEGACHGMTAQTRAHALPFCYAGR